MVIVMNMKNFWVWEMYTKIKYSMKEIDPALIIPSRRCLWMCDAMI